MNIPNRRRRPDNRGHSSESGYIGGIRRVLWRSRARVVLAGIGILALSAGCGTNLEELLFQSLSGLGRSGVDQWLTDVANNVAAQSDQDSNVDDDPDDTTGDDDADTGAGDTDGTGDGAVDGDGDATDAPVVPDAFANICAACHGDDGASGFAPNIRGKTVDELRAGFSMPSHVPVSVTDEDVAAIAEFLSQ